MTNIIDSKIVVRLQGLEDEMKKITRRQDDLQKELSILTDERKILEDIQASIQYLKQIIVDNQQHQDNTKRDLRADVKESQFAMEDKVDEIKKMVDSQTIVVKSTKDSIFKKVRNMINGKKEIKL